MNMSIELHQRVAEAHPYNVLDGIDDVFVEAIWHELDCQLPRQRVRWVVAGIALGFQDATVKTFLPILVRRQALVQLRKEINQIVSTDNYLLDDQS